MEEDDEFGDLYSDVLQPFSSTMATSSSAPQTHQSSTLNRPIDLNLNTNDNNENLYGSFRKSDASNQSDNQTLVSSFQNFIKDDKATGEGDSDRNSAGEKRGKHAVEQEEGSARGLNLANRGLRESSYGGESGDKDVEMVDQEVKFDIEDEKFDVEEMGAGPIIPGITSGSRLEENQEKIKDSEPYGNVITGADGSREGDEWDSDSEDDLQIVLNDDNRGPMGMERGGLGAEDDDDDDGDPLVIVADNNPNQAMEEHQWAEDAVQAGDGERKEGEAGKPGNGAAIAQKIGYGIHGYHQYHSQFKYVRPGAPSSTTVGSGGPLGQVRPLANVVPIAGRGRVDWRPTGIKNGPLQKGFHLGYGMHAWGAGRGFGGGLEFTLPSHKTIFDIDIDGFEEKPWRYPGVDLSDFFNFDLNEESWKDYRRKLEQLRLESTTQSRIHVIGSGRTEQVYDPDMPPELAAATGMHEVPAENSNLIKSDVGQNEPAKGFTRVRPPFPAGRPIQVAHVENGYGERLPSIDARPPRMRDSECIIEIICQGSLDDDSSPANAALGQPENDFKKENLQGHVPEEDVALVENEHLDGFRQTDDSGKGKQWSPCKSTEKFCSSQEDRPTEGRRRYGSPCISPSQTTEDKSPLDGKEESTESMDDKQCLQSSLVTSRDAWDSSADPNDAGFDKPVASGGESEMGNEQTLDLEAGSSTVHDDNGDQNQTRHKTTSKIEPPARQKSAYGEDSKAARGSHNSKARSSSSREYQKHQDITEEEVIQHGHPKPIGSVKRHVNEDEQGSRRRDHDRRPEMKRNRLERTGREDPYSRKDIDPSPANHLSLKSDEFAQRRERNISDGSGLHADDDSHSRRSRDQDARKREHDDEVGPRHRSRARENERSNKDDYIHLKKQSDSSSYRASHDKDVGSRHRERDDYAKSRYESMEDYYCKRRKAEVYPRRDYIDREEALRTHGENLSWRKRERDDYMDQRKRDGQQRSREQRERSDRRDRDERHSMKQAHDEIVSKREREEGRGTVRSGQSFENESWIGHHRIKDENKCSNRMYQLSEPPRQSEHQRGHEGTYGLANNTNTEGKRLRHEKSSTCNDSAVEVSKSQRVDVKKHRDNLRKNKEPDSSDHNTSSHSRKSRECQSVSVAEMAKNNEGCETPVRRHSSKRQKANATSDEDQQDTKRGRSKLERWTSHNERDLIINTKSSSSSKFKEVDVNDDGRSSESNKVLRESAKPVAEATSQRRSSPTEKDTGNPQSNDTDKPMEERHLDTVEKLKKRSERFKLPMPSEKDAMVIKKVESEAQTEAPADSEVKPERPARKRRWTSNRL